jgi:phospholipid transport system substrate-binding protein
MTGYDIAQKGCAQKGCAQKGCAQERTQSGRRGVLALGASALLAAGAPWRRVMADTTVSSAPTAPIQHLNGALLAAMKAGGTPFAARYNALAPVLERTFDLQTILARSVGLSWSTLPPAQKTALSNAFVRYTVSSYVSNFDSFNGQSFQVSPAVRSGGDGDVVVRSQLVRTNDSPVELDYVMHQGAGGWQVVDVLMNGSISRVAVQRSDFRALLASGGVPALAATLEHKTANLSGGMVG